MPVEARHANEDDTHVGAGEEVADLLEPVHLELVRFVDDEQLGVVGFSRVPAQLWVVVGLGEPADVSVRNLSSVVQIVEQLPRE